MSLIGLCARLIVAALAAAAVPTVWVAYLLFPELPGTARAYDPLLPFIVILMFCYLLSAGFLRRRKMACFLSLAFVAAAIGPAMMIFLHLLGGGLPAGLLTGNRVELLSQVGLAGALSALMFWIVVRKAG